MLPRSALALALGLVCAGLVCAAPVSAAAADPSGEGLHRGRGWYDADLRVPEPPLALALVILGAAAMRRRDRRLLAAGASPTMT